MELVIDVTFLRGLYEAGGRRDSDPPNWPPSPARLVNALVASADDEEDFGAIEWLETLPPPTIVASDALTSGGRSSYVPTNRLEPAGTYGDYVGRKALGPRQWWSISPADPTVSYRWQVDGGDAPDATRVAEIASRVPYLGRSTSPVLAGARVEDEPDHSPDAADRHASRQRWVPTEEAFHQIRVPRPGYVLGLRSAFEADQQPWEVPPALVGYGLPEVERAEVVKTPYSQMITIGFAGGRRFGPNQAMLLTSRLREAVESHLDGGPKVLRGEEAVARADGRTPHHYVAFAALPFVGAPHAGGQIMGLGVAIPRATAEDDRLAVLRGLRLVVQQGLNLGKLGKLRLEAIPQSSATLNPRRWSSPSTTWASALPITAGRYLNRANPETLRADLLRNIEHLELPEPLQVNVSTGPLLIGASDIQARYRVHGKERAKPSYHAIVRFAEPVAGTMLLGSQRSYGLGLMLPTDPLAAGRNRALAEIADGNRATENRADADG